MALSEATKTACAKEIAASKAAAEQWNGDLNELFLASDDAGRDDANKTLHDHLAEWSKRLTQIRV